MAWLTSVLQSAPSVTSSVVAGAIGGLAAGGRCDCHCEWSAAPDQGLLQLLQRQLDRCGPEQLHGQVCPALPPPLVATLALVGVGLFTGVLFGACLDGWRQGEPRPEWFPQLQRGSRVLARYEGYPLWHERLLVARLAPSRWVVATPSGDIYDEDLMESDGVHRVGPRGGLGAGMANAEVLRFVNLTAPEKRELLEGGEDYVRDNEGDPDIDAESRQVLVAQHVLPPRGGAGPDAGVPAAALPGAAAGVAWVAAESRRGFTLGRLLAPGDGGVFAVPSVGERDLRSLPVRFDRNNRRFREYCDAAVCLLETARAGWSVAWPRTCKWLLRAIRDAGWTPAQRHFWWRNLPQVSPSDAGAEERAYISEVLERACVFDQLNCSELETFEVLWRRYQLWEELRAPELHRAAEAGEEGDGSWLRERRVFLGSSQSKGAALVCPALEEHAAGKLAQVVGYGMARGPQRPDDRPRDLLPFPGGQAIDELLLGATGGGLSAAGKRKARRRRGEGAWLCAGLDAVSELGGSGRASSDAQVTAAQGSGLLCDPAEAQAALHALGPAMALGPVLRLRGFTCGRFLAELLDMGILEKATVVKETAGAFLVKRKVCFYQCELPASLRPLFVAPPILARCQPARRRKRLELADVERAFQARVVPMGWGALSKTGLGGSSAAVGLPEHQWVGRALLELKER
ncbi:unnamed protein product [Prorocentrum cordatum]|uniref:Uncharacterized protein n=1 Tax=Prorocentrum cordatum TaxID=2364126 RepID=A0ABN9W4X6_9DINO|nr:unnamed protein product [Polarella glacialis]